MRTMILLLVAAAFVPLPTHAQQPDSYGIGKVEQNRDETQVTPDYYTRIQVTVDRPTFPPAGKKSKALIAALLKAFGGKSSNTRTIAVILRTSVGGTRFPDQTLIGYTMSTDTNSISAEVNNVILPMTRLNPGESFDIHLEYRDAKAANVELLGVGKKINELLPGVSVLSPLSKPFVDSISGVAQEVFSAMGSGQVKSAWGDNLSPYGEGIKKLDIPLLAPTGDSLGAVHLSLQATPTLARDPIDVFKAKSSDFEIRPGENIRERGLSTAAGKRTFASELRALPAYQKLVADRSVQTAADFCAAGTDVLSQQFGLTSFDRVQLVYWAARDTGLPKPSTDSRWYAACFSPTDLELLNRVLKLSPAYNPEDGASVFSAPMFWALGCWMLESPGPKCQEHAPDAGGTLRTSLAATVYTSVDSGFIDAGVMGPPRAMSREELLGALKGKASGFKCRADMLVFKSGIEMPYRLSGTMEREKLTSIHISAAPDGSPECTGD